MSLIRSKDTSIERRLSKLIGSKLYRMGYRYRRNYNRIVGKPDIAIVSKKIAIFADGDFWHGYNFKIVGGKLPRRFWLPKIKRNIERDRKVNRELKRRGWKVLRFWEHDIKRNPEKILEKILRALAE